MKNCPVCLTPIEEYLYEERTLMPGNVYGKTNIKFEKITEENDYLEPVIINYDLKFFCPECNGLITDGVPLRSTTKDAIIVDIDGTISLICDRSPYDYPKAVFDRVNQNVLDVVDKFRPTHMIILLTGRDEECKDVTLAWLEKNKIGFDLLFMRKNKDRRQDDIVKKEIYKNNIKDKYNVTFILEDRNRVVAMWRSIGLTCLQVADGNY